MNDIAIMTDDDDICFMACMPGLTSRTNYELIDSIQSAGFTVSAFCPESKAEANGILKPHFQGRTVSRQADGVFRSDECRWPGNEYKTRYLKFFAFHPSQAEMMKCAGVGAECFSFSNATVKNSSGVDYDYPLTKFRVAPDISRQVDFVTAIGEGDKTDNLYSGVKLEFEHQLCGVEIGVWGASSLYDVEIAGVRIGGTIVEADFNLSTEIINPVDDDNTVGSWLITDSSLYGHVDYVFAEGDKVIGINANEHNSKDRYASIMGKGGKAMVIPFKNDKWDYVNDRENHDNGMYFSALIRMTQREGDHHRTFPCADPASQDYLVYLSVRKSDGTVMKRLDKNGNVHGTNAKYTIPSTEELRHAGSASGPANVEWKAGYTYSYILDYTKGVGVHDPVDSNPAIAIIDWVEGIEVVTPGTESQWGDGETIEYGGWGANSNNTAPDGTVWWK